MILKGVVGSSHNSCNNKKRERFMLPFIILTAYKNCTTRVGAHPTTRAMKAMTRAMLRPLLTIKTPAKTVILSMTPRDFRQKFRNRRQPGRLWRSSKPRNPRRKNAITPSKPESKMCCLARSRRAVTMMTISMQLIVR